MGDRLGVVVTIEGLLDRWKVLLDGISGDARGRPLRSPKEAQSGFKGAVLTLR